jgi:hypothetical protein
VLEGRLSNTTGRGVRNATATLTGTGTTTRTFTATTNDTGVYRLTNLANGTYNLTFTSPGYTASTAVQVTIPSTALRSDSLFGTTSATGFVANSANLAQPVVGATVSFAFGTNDALTDLRVVTDTLGVYRLNRVPSGNFIRVVEGASIIRQSDNNIRLDTGINTFPDPIGVTTRNFRGDYRVVLTWGETPDDLDSHLSGPLASGSKYVMYFGERLITDGTDTLATLDVDDTESFGPETTTFRVPRNGIYRYSIRNYSDRDSSGHLGIFNSPSRVQLFSQTGLVAAYTHPTPTSTSRGDTWRVFEVVASGTNGATPVVNPINTYVQAATNDDSTVFRSGTPKPRLSKAAASRF